MPGCCGLELRRLPSLILVALQVAPSLPGALCWGAVARFRVVRCKAHGNVADPVDGGDVFMYRDSSIVPSLDPGRRCILSAGSVYPITQDDLQLVLADGIGEFRGVVGELHCRLGEFIHRAIRGWSNVEASCYCWV